MLCLLSIFPAKAQHTLRGVVTDAATGEPIDVASVQLLKGAAGKLAGFALTDAQGAFTLATSETDSLEVYVTLLGYKPHREPVASGGSLRISLKQQAFQIREVEIRPGRVWGKQDTVNYDVAQFLSGSDETIKDVIRKLPGVDVDDLGKISYKGKDISKLYVEGMDLTDGRYSQITNNLDARSVETVQLLDNHQPIRILQDKVKTEDVALNLKLKPEFRDKWMATLRGGGGFSPFLWDASANALQLSRNSQSAYLYKGNNAGQDVTDENLLLTGRNFGRMREPAAPSFLTQPSIEAPVRKERLLFNDVHSLTANRLYRLGETTQLRLNAGYTHDVRKQERGSETVYYQAADTVRLAEEAATRLRSDEAELSLNYEDNAAGHFLTNRFQASGNWQESRSGITAHPSVSQQIRTTDLGLRNDFRNLWDRKDYTLEARSTLRYHHLPARLTVDGAKESHPLNDFFTDNSFTFLKKTAAVSHQYAAGFTAQSNTLADGFSLYALPSWQLNQGQWLANLALPVVWTRFGSDLSRLALNPSLSVTWKLNYAWRFNLSGSYRESYGDLTHLYTSPYRTDYRNETRNSGTLPVQRRQTYSAYGEYKNTVQEFFATLSASHWRNRSDQMYEQLYADGVMVWQSHGEVEHSFGWSANGTLSKGFYDWNMKASLNCLLSRSRGEQLSGGGVRLPYRYDYMQYQPKINWSPSRRWQADYEATIACRRSEVGGQSPLPALWNTVQKLQISYQLFPVEVRAAADHYHNEVSRSRSVDNFFADLSIRWKAGDWQLEAKASNLFDNRQYRYTEYSANRSYTSWIDLRGREFLFAARYRF